MTTLVITAIGGDVAQGVALAIRDAFPDWRLIGTDMGTRHGGGLIVDTLIQAPSARDPGYVDWLKALLAKTGASYCIPMSEPELAVLAAHGLGRLGGAKLITAGAKALELGADKLATAQFLTQIGLTAPWSKTDPDALRAAQFPCIYKPRSGAGSKAVFRCETESEGRFLAARYPGGLFQELLLPDDAEITCGVFRDSVGRVAVVQLLRQLVGGATGWAQVVDHPEITQTCTAIAEAVDLCGGLNVQLRLTEEGPRVFEINARFSSTSLMRHQMGFQDVVWTLQDLQGQRPSLFHPAVGTCAVRMQGVALLADPIPPTGDT